MDSPPAETIPILQNGQQNEDESKTKDCVGYLKKKNRWGFWQSRYFKLDDNVLTYFKNEKLEKPRPELFVEEMAIDDFRFGKFTVYCAPPSSKELQLRAKPEDFERWVEALQNAEKVNNKLVSKKEREEQLREKITETSLGKLRDMEGFLQMGSVSRFKKWQHRYFRLKGFSLLYYKDESKSPDDYEGEISLVDKGLQKTKVEVSDSGTGRDLEVITTNRTYTLKAPSSEVAKDWAVAINERIEAGYKIRRDDTDEEKSDIPEAKKVPKWISDWDAQIPQDNNVIKIQAQLNNLFPPNAQLDLQRTLNSVTLLIEELDDKARECLPVGGDPHALTETGREARPDIFEVILRFFNFRIVHELSQFVNDQKYENLSVKELLRFMDLITAYDAKIKEMLVGEVGEHIQGSVLSSGLMDNAENMSEVYLKQIEAQIATWVENVASETKKGESVVAERYDGRFQTNGPTNLFNLLNEALTLARISGMQRLQSKMLSTCAVSLADYLFIVMKDLTTKPKDGSPPKSESFPYVAAMANDCWSVIDHVDTLERNHKTEAFKVDLQPLRDKCAAHAETCLELLANMVKADLKETMITVFTKEHLESRTDKEDSIAIVCATLDDYLEDFSRILELTFIWRITGMIIRDTIGSYLQRLSQAYHDEGLTALTKRQIDLIGLDRKRLLACLEGRLSKANPNLNVERLYQSEIAPLDIVLDMLRCPPTMIASTAVAAAQNDPTLQPQILLTAKMCVDLNCYGSGGTEKLVRDLKGNVLDSMEKITPASVPADQLEYHDKKAFVRMWGGPGKKTSTATKISVNDEKKLAHDEIARETQPAPVEAVLDNIKMKKLEKQNSKQWLPPTKFTASATTPLRQVEEDIPIPVDAPLVPLVEGILSVKFGKNTSHISSFCTLRPYDEKHRTDFVFKVLRGQTAINPVEFSIRISDIARVEYWETLPSPAPKHFGPDGKAVEDDPNQQGRTANRDVEFSIMTKNGQKSHYICGTPALATEWIKHLHEQVEKSFEKWGNNFVEGQEEYMKMDNKKLKALAKERGLDITGLNEKSDFVRLLKNSPPPGTTTTTPPLPSNKPSQTEVAKPAPGGEIDDYSKMTVTQLMALAKERKVNIAGLKEKTEIVNALKTANSTPSVDPNLTLPKGLFSKSNIDGAKTQDTKATSNGQTPPPASQTPPPPSTITPPVVAAAAASSVAATAQQTPVNKPSSPPLRPAASNATLPVVASTPSTTTTRPVVSSTPQQATATVVSSTPQGAAPTSRPMITPQVVAAVPSTPPIADSNEQTMLEIQELIREGYMLLDEKNPGASSRVFTRARDMAIAIGHNALRAKALMGLASAYREMPSMIRASAPNFALAASFFKISGDSSDRINAITEATEMFVRVGDKGSAVKLLEAYDNEARKLGGVQIFQNQIKELKGN